jgi:glucose-6-phosphate-specific signal transduction histidine kinase
MSQKALTGRLHIPADPRVNPLFGFQRMRERASLLGGRLVVSSARGKGTAIEANLPSAPSPIPVAG